MITTKNYADNGAATTIIEEEDVKPTINQSGNQSSSSGCQMTYTKQEVFMLTQAYMQESCD